MEKLNKVEEAANHYASVTDQEAHGTEFICEVFVAGAEWDREQMMEEVVEATVMATKCGDKYQQLLITDWNSSDGLHNGDKVKIIVIHETDIR